MRAVPGILLLAVFCFVAAARANEMDISILPPAPPPKEPVKVETECPPGSFKFEGTCWVQGDCPEGEALYKQGVCLPIPNWRFAPPVEEETPETPPNAEPEKTKR